MNVYPFKATVRLKAEFTNQDGDPTNPTQVVLRVENPNGVETTYTDAVQDSVGFWHRDVLVGVAGYWTYRWEGTGAVAQVDEDVFQVMPTAFDNV